MISPIRIVDSGAEVELYTGIFSVYVLGGWDIDMGDFTFSLTNTKSGRVIKPKVTRWKVQSYEFGEKAKKIMVLDIPESGNYSIEFKNQDSLKVWTSELPFISGLPFITRLITLPAEKQYIQIAIK
ncbi:hypothetical protein [Mangrovimonas aestuarii]|uniref:hypothetical protein n=1 Tax=Mangrovimonas aestuarii TaxID=3018443 RepID=UPI00237942E1|nr:hypothetical protein [Mangrovimonas aestuarii]